MAWGFSWARCRPRISALPRFFAFLLCVPMLFMMRPILHIANVLLFDGIFLVCVTRFKDWRVIPMDVCNALVFGAISCIVSTFVMNMMYGNFITSSKLTTVAESDLNTRLHNRNAYENRLRDYPLRCSNNLTCVYIDVNGLHELNNTYGHEEGDKMLRTVACILREIFGEEDSYRIGGDEFVAFALDSTDTELNENMEQFVRQVEEAGYSVAVGTASHSAGGIDIDALVKKAEQRMYLDKSRHYEQLRHGTEE